MMKADKTRAAIAAYSGNLRFEQVDAYLLRVGASSRQSGGSHVVYLLPGGGSVTIVKPHAGRTTIKPIYIKNLDAQLRKEGL